MTEPTIQPNATGQLLEEVLVQHHTLVQRIAHHLLVRIPAGVQLDDLIQAGLIGLMDAHQHFDASKGASFITYAGIRIRGSILDEVRKHEWAPRSAVKKLREIAAAAHHVESRSEHAASQHEVAEEMGLTALEFDTLSQAADRVHRVSLEDWMDSGEETGEENRALSSNLANPFDGVAHSEFHQQLVLALKMLPEREQLALSLYYEQDLNLKEIGVVLSVSESRISQILSKAIAQLKIIITDP